MNLAARSASALAVAMLTLALAGCGQDKGGEDAPGGAGEGASAPVAEATAAPADGGAGESGGACPTVPQEGYELFSSDAVAVAPADGAVYGDGTSISWTLAEAYDGTPDVDMSYINEAGDAIPMGGIFLEDMGNNEWGSTLNVFTSDADGRPGYMLLGLTTDVGLADDGTATGNHEVIGIYCVTFKVAP